MKRGSSEQEESSTTYSDGRVDDATQHTISPRISDEAYLAAVVTHSWTEQVAKSIVDEQTKAFNSARAMNQQQRSKKISEVRHINKDVQVLSSGMKKDLEAMFSDEIPPEALTNDGSIESVRYKTYKQLGGHDVMPTICSNTYKALPDEGGKICKINYTSNPPTQCIYKKSVSKQRKAKHERKMRGNPLSRFQLRLADMYDEYRSKCRTGNSWYDEDGAKRTYHSAYTWKRIISNITGDYVTETIPERIYIDPNPTTKRVRRRNHRRFRDMYEIRRFGNAEHPKSIETIIEEEFQSKIAGMKALTIKSKIDAVTMNKIAGFVDNDIYTDLQYVKQMESLFLQRRRKNHKRQARRIKLRNRMIKNFCLHHIDNQRYRERQHTLLKREDANNAYDFLKLFCANHIIKQDMAEVRHHVDNNLTVQSREQWSLPVRMFLEGLDILKDPENYDYTTVINFSENLITTMVLMNHSKNWQIALLNLKQWISMTFGATLCGTIYTWVENLFKDEIQVQAGGLDMFRQIFTEWKGIYNGEFMSKVKKAVACIVALGFCTLNKLPFCTDSFSNEYKKGNFESRSYPDLVTCILDTIIMVFEKAHSWFKGDCGFLDIFRSPSAAYSYDVELAFLRANISLYEENKLDTINLERYVFEERVQEVIRLTKAFYERSTGPERRIMQINLNDLARIQTKMLLANQAMTIREAPFTYYLYGKSSIGKTAVADIINNALLRANGLSPDPKFQVSLNPADKYQSELESWTIVIKMDDLANEKVEYSENNPSQMIVDYVNNNPRHALKADVDSKGKVLIQPKILMATTNVKDVEAHVKSNEPLSIIRRLNKCITMVVKPQYCKQGSHMLDPSKMTDIINDAWLFHVEEPQAIHTDQLGATPFKFVTVTHDGVVLKNIGMKVLLAYLIDISKQHFIEQKRLVDSVHLVQQTDLCPHGTYEQFCSDCPIVPLEVQSRMSDEASKIAMEQLKKVHRMWFVIMEYIPYHLLEGDGWWYYSRTVLGCATSWFIAVYYQAIVLVMLLLYIFFGSFFCQFFIQTFVTYVGARLFDKCWNNIDKIHKNCKKVAQDSMKMLEPVVKHKYYVAAGLGTVGIVLLIARRLRSVAPVINEAITTQGSAYRTPEPDKVQRENVWVKPEILIPPRTIEVSTTTLEQMTHIVSRAISNATFKRDTDGKTVDCCAFPIKGNVWMVPHHVVLKQFNSVELIRSKGDINDNRECRINQHSWVRIADTDMVLICLPSAGDVADMTSYFPDSMSFYCEPVRWIHKDNKADVAIDDFLANMEKIKFKDSITDHVYEYDGWNYVMSQPTRNGLCMAALISKGKFPWILGFHSAGSNGTPNARGHFILRSDLDKTYDILFNRSVGDEMNINVQCHSSGTMNLNFKEFNIEHTGEMHYKSPFNFMERAGCALLYGKHTAPRRTFRSSVEDAVIAKSVCERFDVPMMYGKPKYIGSWKPWHDDATKLLQPTDMNIDVLGHAYADFERHIFKFLDANQEYKDILSPMSRVATLSGVDGCRGIDAIKLATSAGFPRCKPKSNYVFVSDEEHDNITRPLDVSPEIWAEVSKLEDILARGERVYFIHRINLKDEPTKLEKDKVRTFAGCSLECLILIRMYFLPIAKMMMDHPDVFECAIGINAHGPEWTELTNRMMKHGADRTIAGDYRDYDTRMWCYLVLLAFGIFINIAIWAGYSERQITIMRGIATELAYGLTDYNGEYVMFLIQNLSGHGLTVFINNLVNSIYQRYAYYDIWSALASGDNSWIDGLKQHLNMDDAGFAMFKRVYMSNVPDGYPKPFAENISLVCYGDDNKMSVSRDINYFNHCTISYSLGRCGIGYTMADKTSESVPFIHASECGFLKRHGVWSEEFQQFLAPLELKSLFKTLQSSLVSKVLSREQQAVEAIDSVLRELFYHGEDVYNDWKSKLDLVVDDCDLRSYFKDHSLHTYEYLKSEYVRKYLCDSDIKNSCASNSIDEIAKTEVIVLDTQSHDSTRYQSGDKALLFQGSAAYLSRSSPAQGIRPHDDDNHSHHVVIQRVANTTTMNKVNNVSSFMGPEAHENIVFRDGTPQWESSIVGGYDETRKVGMDNTVPIESFFSRPVKLDLPNWIPGSATPYEVTLDPWNVFYTNKRVSNRISNFKLLQSTLKIKFVINGNMFYYGRLMADYAPMADYRNVDRFGTDVPVNRIAASQRTHLFLNPTTSQGGEIHMPFVYPKNALDITTGEWVNMGKIFIRELNPLKHANASTTPVSVTAYIWAEDVLLSVPTTVNAFGITAQSGDEYGTGVVSNLASNIAKLSGKMESIPMIAPYAKATTMAANGMGQMAKLFGYSRPPIIDAPTDMRAKPISSMAVCDCPDGASKLTMDSKQELTIDPRVVGLDTGDELSIKSIAGKESYLTQFPWVVSAITDTLLWNTRVGPNHAVIHPSFLVDTAYQMPACQFAALPFQYWKGTMRYRFQIVASDFHRGRLKIVYDPSYIIGAETNVGFSRIIDLTVEKDFTIDVSWGQTQTYLKCSSLSASVGKFGTSVFNVTDPQYNGVLGVYVVNDLTTPNSTTNNDIQVNVFISMCDDVEFQAPTNRLGALSWTPQSNESSDAAEMEEDNAPVQSSNDDSIMQCAVVDHTDEVYFGETITSFRSLLKRYTYLRSWLNPVTGRSNWTLSLPDYPLNRGVMTGGIDSVTPGPVAANVVLTGYIGYLAPAYLAMRGGFRHKYLYNSDKITDLSYAIVERNEVAVSQTAIGIGSTNTAYLTTNPSIFADRQIAIGAWGLRGAVATALRVQPVLEVDLPNYNNNRFTLPKNFTSSL